MDEQRRGLVGIQCVVTRTGLSRTTIKRAAAAGLVPGATKLLGAWRFDPDRIEAWIEAGRPKPQQTTEPTRGCYPSPAAPEAEHHQRAEAAPSVIPPLLVLFKDAPWRGINDQPAEGRPSKRQGKASTEVGRAADRRGKARHATAGRGGAR